MPQTSKSNATANHSTSKTLVNENTRTHSQPHTQKPPCSTALTNHTTPTPALIRPHHHLKSLRIHQTPLSATIRRQPLDKLRRPRMRIRPHHAPVHRKRLHLRIHTLLADLHITIRIERHHRTVDLPLRTRRHLHIPQPPHPTSTAQTKSPANNTHLQTSKPKIKVNATADLTPPRYLSMKIHVLLHCPHTQKPCSKSLTQQHTNTPLIRPHHHLKCLRIHQTPLSATIRRQPLDKLRRPRMRIRPHHAPVHRKRLHLRIHTLLADLHITIRIERHHRTVDLPLRTRRHLHIPELPHPASTAQTNSPANNTHLQTSKPKIKVNAYADRPPPRKF